MVSSRQTALAGADFDTWLSTLQVRWSPAQIEVVRHAYALGGEPELAVADLLADLRVDYEVVVAALLHEPVAAGQVESALVEEEFGPAVARLVDGIAKLDAIGELHQSGQHVGHQLESLRKMLLAMAQDVRVVLIKLAMRLHELRQFGQHPAAEQCRIAQETLDIFTPLANRLGIGRIKWEMEDLALRYLEPPAYKQIATALDQRRADRESYIHRVVEELRDRLRQVGIRAEVSGRVKHIYSIWRKMQKQGLDFSSRSSTCARCAYWCRTVRDCYAALGVVHSHWTPHPQGVRRLHRQPQGATATARCTPR
jgi:GTP pyrophosphokinase